MIIIFIFSFLYSCFFSSQRAGSIKAESTVLKVSNTHNQHETSMRSPASKKSVCLKCNKRDSGRETDFHFY